MSAESQPNFDHMVILVHGMNTRGHWMDGVRAELESHGFFVAQTSFGVFPVWRFLSFPFLRRTAVGRLETDFHNAALVFRKERRDSPTKISIIAHSFGTWLTLKMLEKNSAVDLYRLIFCGSVVNENFDMNTLLRRIATPLLNHIGTKDYWPAIAESAGWGYGSIGSTGASRPGIQNIWHKGFKHSDVLNAKFCRTYWVPFLAGGAAPRSDPAVALPRWIRFIAKLPLRWLPFGILLLIAATAYFKPLISCFDTTPEFEISWDTDYPKGDMNKKGAQTASVKACEELCAITAQCAGFTFVPAGTSGYGPDTDNTCWLKKSPLPQPVRRVGVVSGSRKVEETDLLRQCLTKFWPKPSVSIKSQNQKTAQQAIDLLKNSRPSLNVSQMCIELNARKSLMSWDLSSEQDVLEIEAQYVNAETDAERALYGRQLQQISLVAQDIQIWHAHALLNGCIHASPDGHPAAAQ